MTLLSPSIDARARYSPAGIVSKTAKGNSAGRVNGAVC